MKWRREDGYEIDTEPGRLDVTRVHEWLSRDAYWALGRSAEVVARSIAGSLCFGVYAPDGTQVGFARVITDGVTFSWLCDVYIGSSVRGQGLGTWLATRVTHHLLELGIPRVLLATKDAHEVYAKAGFAPLIDATRWMEIDLRGVTSPTHKEP